MSKSAQWYVQNNKLNLFLTLYLDELKKNYRETYEKSHDELVLLCSKIKNAIDLARPFYESRRQSNEYLKQLKIDSIEYERSKTNLAAAKEMVHTLFLETKS